MAGTLPATQQCGSVRPVTEYLRTLRASSRRPRSGGLHIPSGSALNLPMEATATHAAERPEQIAFTTTDSPFGPLFLAGGRAGLLRVGLPGTDFDLLVEELAERRPADIDESSAELDPARSQLDEYFDGRRLAFELPLDLRGLNGFRRRAIDRIAAIPYGHTATYAEIAAEAGSPLAHRAAGTACATNPIPIVIPCHRVLASGGAVGGYGGGAEMKLALLNLEGGRAG